MTRIRSTLRDLRYALPQLIEPFMFGPGLPATVRRCARLDRLGLASTAGYFQSSKADPEQIFAANIALIETWKVGTGRYLSVKAPPLNFDPGAIRAIAEASRRAGIPILFDAHTPRDAEQTLGLVAALVAEYPGTGFALPARWRRSRDDAVSFREGTARIRLVKGEWADPDFSDDIGQSYLGLAAMLAGRTSPVAVATHDPELAEQALSLLLAAGTPCELEQLRGLPSRRTMAVARRFGVPIRVYVPFGPGWWPYAIDKALGRPYLPVWMFQDRWGAPKAVLRPSAR